MNGPSKWCLPVALLLLASGCSSGSAATRGGGSLDDRANDLEQKNRALQAELSQKNAQVEQAFATATQAENAAGLQNLGCVGVAPAKGAPRGLPSSGNVHAKLGLAHQSYKMTATFSPPRSAGNWRVAQGNCRVTSP